MSSRRTLILALLVAATFCELFAYYSVRTFAAVDFMSSGGLYYHWTAFARMLVWTGILGAYMGAGISLVIGPRITAAVGAVIAIVALVVSLFVKGNTAFIGMPMMLSLGTGIFRICPWVAGAQAVVNDRDLTGANVLSAQRFGRMMAFAVALYGMTNLAAALAAPIIGTIRDLAGPSPSTSRSVSTGIAIAIFFLSTIFVVVAEILTRADARRAEGQSMPNDDPYRAAGEAPQSQQSPTTAAQIELQFPVTASLGLKGLAILGIAAVFWNLGGSLDHPPSRLMMGMTARSMGWLFSINPIVLFFTCIGGFVFFLMGTTNRSRTPPTFILASALAIQGVGFLIVSVSHVAASAGIYVLGALASGVGEIAGPIALAYAALAARGRRATPIVVAVWMTVGSIVSTSTTQSDLLNYSVREGVEVLCLVISGIALIVTGVIFLTRARVIHGLFDETALATPPPV